MTTYGTLTLRPNGHWHVTDLQPHVAIAFKRLFPKVPATATEPLLVDTDETRADLHWFMQRYPLRHAHDSDLQAGHA